MGRSYYFECGRCEYRVAVSGGSDRGVCFGVQTISCLDCKALYDSVTKLKAPEAPLLSRWRNLWTLVRQKASPWHRQSPRVPSFQEALGRLPTLGASTGRWIQFRLQCPVSAAHRVESWNDPGKCPKCGQFMEQSALPFRLWD